MTVVPTSIDPSRFLEEQLAQASPDLLRQLLSTFIQTLLSADADAVCGAAYGAVSDGRVNRRNGYRHRDFDTRRDGSLRVQSQGRFSCVEGGCLHRLVVNPLLAARDDALGALAQALEVVHRSKPCWH